MGGTGCFTKESQLGDYEVAQAKHEVSLNREHKMLEMQINKIVKGAKLEGGRGEQSGQERLRNPRGPSAGARLHKD